MNNNDRYRTLYGDRVLTFSKREMDGDFDHGDNFDGRRGVTYARNACWQLAEQVNVRYFIQLDDDYGSFGYRLITGEGISAAWTQHKVRNIDRVFDAMISFVASTPTVTVAMSQGGEHGNGTRGITRLLRKAMNSFVCDTERPFQFVGRINEDVSTYVSLGNVGLLFFTLLTLQLNQTTTQQAAGGLTGIYLDVGTYVKSFYSVMYSPSCVHALYDVRMRRIHHHIDWRAAVPKIINERHRIGVA